MADGWQLVLLGVTTTSLVAFFAWLATRVVDMGQRIVGIERDVKSLIGTREEQKADEKAGTGKRLDDLERKK